MATPDPSEIITNQFPRGPFNFDTPPPGTFIGPLKAQFVAAGGAVAQFLADVLIWRAQTSVQNAAGPYLDAHGVLYGVLRFPNELDTPYRARVLAAVYFGRLTCPAIAAAVLAYLQSQNPNAPAAPIVNVYDNQTDPADAAAIGLIVGQFVVDIQYPIPASKVFWAGRSYAGRNAFAINPYTVFTGTPTDAGLVAVVNRNKAAGFQPIWRLRRYIVAHT